MGLKITPRFITRSFPLETPQGSCIRGYHYSVVWFYPALTEKEIETCDVNETEVDSM